MGGQNHGLADSCRADRHDHRLDDRGDHLHHGSQFQQVTGTDRSSIEEHAMPKSTGKYGILVAVDGSPESDAAVRWAVREAELRDSSVTLAHVVVPVVTSWPVRSFQAEFNAWQEDNARQVLEQGQKMLRSTLGESATPDVRTEVLHDYAVPALVRASKKATMIVVGSRGL